MGARGLHYDLDEWREMVEEGHVCHRYYMTASARDDEGHEVSIVTNASGDGSFTRVLEGGGVHYRQLMGTLQYHAPRTEAGIRAALRRLHERAYEG